MSVDTNGVDSEFCEAIYEVHFDQLRWIILDVLEAKNMLLKESLRIIRKNKLILAELTFTRQLLENAHAPLYTFFFLQHQGRCQ